MKTQFTNTVEKLKEDFLRAITVVNNDTGMSIVCNKTGAELIAEYGTIETFFNGLFEKGIKALKITDKLKNGSAYRKFGDDYIFEFTPSNAKVAPQAVAPVEETKNYGLNGGLNAVQIYRDMDYPKVEAKLLSAEAENKVLTIANQKLEMKLALIEAVGQKSDSQKESNAQMFATAAPILEALAGKLLAQNPAVQAPALNGANLSEVKQHAIRIITSLDEEIVDNINIIMLKAKHTQVDQGILDLADMAIKLN